MDGEAVDFATWAQVHEALQEYADALDRGDIASVVQVFSADAVWEYMPGRLHHGHAGIAGFFNERIGKFARTSHNVGPPVVRRRADGIGSTAYFEAKHQLTDGSTYCVWGRYVDRLVPVEGRLRIAHRAVVAHVTEGTSRAYTMLPRVPPTA